MKSYKEFYEHYEESTLHKGISEVENAENELAAIIQNIADPALKAELDIAVGKISRAYEMQGFGFGYDVAAVCEVVAV